MSPSIGVQLHLSISGVCTDFLCLAVKTLDAVRKQLDLSDQHVMGVGEQPASTTKMQTMLLFILTAFTAEEKR
jgi:hypothetical protein